MDLLNFQLTNQAENRVILTQIQIIWSSWKTLIHPKVAIVQNHTKIILEHLQQSDIFRSYKTYGKSNLRWSLNL